MNINSFKHQMFDGGDCYINYISPVSKKFKYHIATLDFSSATSRYIYDKWEQSRLKNQVLPAEQVPVFCYDLDEFKIIDTTLVTSILPLNKVVRQPLDNQANP